MTERRPLPARRPSITESFEVVDPYTGASQAYTITAGIDPETLEVREIFLNGAKEGSNMEAVMGDAAVIVSVALQHGIPLADLAKSMGRIRLRPARPAELDEDGDAASVPASAIGAGIEAALGIATAIAEIGCDTRSEGLEG